MARKFKIEINWTPGDHSSELEEACFKILLRYMKAQKNCCVCQNSRTMKNVKKLVYLYRNKDKWDDWDHEKINALNSRPDIIKHMNTCGERWMKGVFMIYPKMWC